jgi:hypothetical protein
MVSGGDVRRAGAQRIEPQRAQRIVPVPCVRDRAGLT